jgi:CRP-like cAMP-binding protein
MEPHRFLQVGHTGIRTTRPYAFARAPLGNRLLRALPVRDYELLRPHLASVQLEQYAVLFSADAKITRAYFPYNCLISLLVPLSDGETIAAAEVGRDGVVGSSAALGAPHAINDAVVCIPGSAATIEMAALTDLAESSVSLRHWLFRHCHFKRALAQQGAVCVAKHPTCARLCRLLMRIYDFTGRTEFFMTQELLARMLGLQRVSVTLAAERLRQSGLITYRRGHIQIIKVRAVEQAACECYQAVNDKQKLLLESRAAPPSWGNEPHVAERGC